jgi:uncharacterized damage-inducible protein DinB
VGGYMDIKTCKLLAQYNQITNQKMNAIIRNLSHAQWNQEFEGYFKSIKQVCSHIYVADHNWLKRFGHVRDFHFIRDPLFDQNLSYSSDPFDTIDDYILKREQLDKKLMVFVEEIIESDLEKILSFRNTKGEIVNRNFGGSILYVFNHQTHHRGMISIYLDSMKIDNDFSSLLSLV